MEKWWEILDYIVETYIFMMFISVPLYVLEILHNLRKSHKRIWTGASELENHIHLST